MPQASPERKTHIDRAVNSFSTVSNVMASFTPDRIWDGDEKSMPPGGILRSNYRIIASVLADMRNRLSALGRNVGNTGLSLAQGQPSGGGSDIDEAIPCSKWVPEVLTATFTDLVGFEREKLSIRKDFVLPLENPTLFPSSGVLTMLLYGPPGTGKTFFVRSIGAEINKSLGADSSNPRAFVFIGDSQSLQSSYVGRAGKQIHSLFVCANERATSASQSMSGLACKSIIFIDEMDTFASKRSDEKSGDNSVTTTLMTEISGFSSHPNVAVIGATNRPWLLDSAVQSRMPVQLMIDIPDDEARLMFIRLETLKSLGNNQTLSSQQRVVLNQVCAMTGMSKSGLESIYRCFYVIANGDKPKAMAMLKRHLGKIGTPDIPKRGFDRRCVYDSARSKFGYPFRELSLMVGNVLKAHKVDYLSNIGNGHPSGCVYFPLGNEPKCIGATDADKTPPFPPELAHWTRGIDTVSSQLGEEEYLNCICYNYTSPKQTLTSLLASSPTHRKLFEGPIDLHDPELARQQMVQL